MKIYDNKKRQEIPTEFKEGQVVSYKGKPYAIRTIDAWAVDEIYLSLQCGNLHSSFQIVESKELD
jgi:hypothetical protein